MNGKHYDLVVVGGGVNGAGIAADAAGRGLKVALFEAKDFACATSSASSKLIHGGLRYLEHYEFRLVREALAEREVLLQKAPHLITPMRFRLPHRPHLRPAWMIRIGMFLYDHLAKLVTLEGSKHIRFGANSALKSEITQGFEYSDGWVDDARLVVANVMQARDNGADVYNYTPCQRAERKKGQWHITAHDDYTQQDIEVTADAFVNAAGPWVKKFFSEHTNVKSPRNVRMIKGSHILVPKLHNESCAYILQNEDRRIVFVIPYDHEYSLIGTTDLEYHGDPWHVKIDPEETQYLCDVVNRHFKKQIGPDDVIWDYSGVRPLCDDESDSPQAITRDYTLEIQDEGGKAPVLSVFGGKLTTYRKLGESALEHLAPYFPNMKGDWTANSPLPGGDCGSMDRYQAQLASRYPFLSDKNVNRIAHAYGSRASQWLGDASSAEQLGNWFGELLSSAEVDYLIDQEWARTADDVLWRRTKLGITMPESAQQRLATYIEQQLKSKGLATSSEQPLEHAAG